jgi:sodium/potassium-transporting ATPase subunit alpha
VRFLLTMTGLFNYVIIVGSALCFIVYGIQTDFTDKQNLYLAVVLLFVILITAIFSFQQQSKAGAIMAQFKNFIPPKALAWRNGEKNEMNAALLVPGDIVEINSGDNIPADVVLIKANEMKVNNSSLTGESEELLRVPEEKSKNIFESPNVAFFGTMCTNGNGVGIVFKTGQETVIGQIANLASNATSGETPIARELDHFIKIVASIAICSGVLFFCINFIYKYPIV